MSEPAIAEQRFAIRPARPSDREAVLAFSRNTWSWGDYLEYVWDEWLAAEDGRLLVGEVDDRPIAVGRARLVAPGQGWLEGLRVDPAVRRSGVGHAMTVATLAAARELGAEVVRFATRADAFPVHRIAERLGFAKVAGYHILGAPALDDEMDVPTPSPAENAETVWRFLSDSARSGVVWRHWHCRTLDRAEVERRVEAGEALGLPRPEGPELGSVSFAVEEPDDGELIVDLVVGRDPPSLTAMGLSLRRLAAERSLDRVEARGLADEAQVSALRVAGFEPIGEADVPFWIFEWRSGRG